MHENDTKEPVRGPDAVRKSLIEAAVQLMATMALPRMLTGLPKNPKFPQIKFANLPGGWHPSEP